MRGHSARLRAKRFRCPLLTPALLPTERSAPHTAASAPSNRCLGPTHLLLVPYLVVSWLVNDASKHGIKAAVMNRDWSVQKFLPKQPAVRRCPTTGEFLDNLVGVFSEVFSLSFSFLNYFFLFFLTGAGCEEGPLRAEGRCRQPARLWGVSCQKGSISASSIPHLCIFLLHFVAISDKGKSTTQTVAHIARKHLSAPSKSQDQPIGKTYPPPCDIPGNSASRGSQGEQQAQPRASAFNGTSLGALE